MWNFFPVLYPKIFISMLRLWASVLETGSSTKSQLKIPRQGGSQSDWQFTKTEIPERDYLILMKPGSISARRFYNVCSSLPAYRLGSRATQQGSKYLDSGCFSLCSWTTTTRDVRLQKTKDVQFLGSSAAWSLQNRSPSSLALQGTGNCQRMDFWIPASLSEHVYWQADGPLGDQISPNLQFHTLILSTQSRFPCSYVPVIWPNGNIWRSESLTALTPKSLASNLLPAWAPPAFWMLCSGAACPINCSWGHRLVPKVTIPSPFTKNFTYIDELLMD